LNTIVGVTVAASELDGGGSGVAVAVLGGTDWVFTGDRASPAHNSISPAANASGVTLGST
jgi:hypothetical protein